MLPIQFNSYKVDIQNRPFNSEQGIQFSYTAAITLYDNNKKEIAFFEKGYIDAETLYKRIDQGKDLILDQSYCENFSIQEYRRLRNIEPDKVIYLHNFSAYQAVFDGKEAIDFSYCDFGNHYKNFEQAVFLNCKVNFHHCNFRKGGINFSYSLFDNGELDFSYNRIESGELNFKNAVFGDGNKNFQNLSFSHGKMLLQNVTFNNGDVSFVDSRLKSLNISFKVSGFGDGKVDFHYTIFEQCSLSFERTEFGKGKVDFRTTEFLESKINFNRSLFGNGDKSFEAAQVNNGKITFKKTDWGDGNINFELVEFDDTNLVMDNSIFGKGELSFHQSKITIISLKSCHLDYYVDLRVNECEFMDLSDTIVRDILDLKPHKTTVRVKELNFSNLRLIGRIFIDWKENNVKQLINSQNTTTTQEKAEQFRILKENFYATGQYSDEDKAYVEFKRKERKAKLQSSIKKNKWNSLWAYPSDAFQWLIFDKVGLYGTDPVRVLSSMVVSYLFFAIMYFILPFISDSRIVSSMGNTGFSELKTAFYHSAITFLTIGYGDYYPEGIIRWLCGLEGFIGLFLMSYFTVAFVRKILR